MGLIFKNLMLEVTRKCNMKCEHCMRGEQQDITMNSKIIKYVLDATSEIDCLTLTGGEPSLAPDAIRWVVYYLKNRGIKLGSFFCATNAAVYSEEFVKQLNELYEYSQNKEKCALSIGNFVKLTYSDNETFNVKKEDFDRAFGPIVSGNKADIKKEYEVKIEG